MSNGVGLCVFWSNYFKLFDFYRVCDGWIEKLKELEGNWSRADHSERSEHLLIMSRYDFSSQKRVFITAWHVAPPRYLDY